MPIAMGCDLGPTYMDADPTGQVTLAGTADTFAAIALVTNAAGNFLGFGVVDPLVAMAILTTRALLRWIGWLGLLAIVRNPPLVSQCRSFSTLGWCRLRLLRSVRFGV
jgi:hypothetical protein